MFQADVTRGLRGALASAQSSEAAIIYIARSDRYHATAMSDRPPRPAAMVHARGAMRSATLSRRKSRRGSALLTLFGWVVVVSGSVSWAVFSPADATAANQAFAPNTLARSIKLALLIGGFAIAFRRLSDLRQLLREVNPWFLGFLALAALSYTWSISPVNTLARLISILSIVAVWTAVCVASWNPHRFQELSRGVTTFIILGSIVFVIVSPDLAIEKGEGTLKDAWHGVISQKNGFGQLSSFGFIFWFHGWLAREVKTWKAMIFGGCAGACVVFSRSSTSLFATLLASLFLLMLLRTPSSLRKSMRYVVAIFALIVLTYAIAVLQIVPGLSLLLEPITSITGKDMTFSNRSVIWDIIKQHIQYSPYIGSGYGAYWIGPDPSSPSYTFLGQMYFYPGEAHNGYLEIVNDLGFVGLVVLFGYFIQYLRQALRLMRFDRNQAALYLAIFFQQAVIDLSESCWFSVNSGYSFIITTFATIALARSALDQRLQGPYQGEAMPRPHRLGTPAFRN